jgi:hypothetical protein
MGPETVGTGGVAASTNDATQMRPMTATDVLFILGMIEGTEVAEVSDSHGETEQRCSTD